MELHMFGGFRVYERGADISVPSGTARVIVFLALAPHRRSHREHLAGYLWPDATRTRSLANLRSALWRTPDLVRPMIESHDSQVRLSQILDVDIDLLSGRPVVTPPVESIVGEFLPGWYDDWIVAERERLELKRVTVLERIANERLEAGECAGAIDVALLAIGAEPYRESLHRIVLAAHAAEGNHSEALCHYRRLCDALESGVGARPSDETERLIACSRHVLY